MSLRERTRPGLGIIEPCLPSAAKAPPSGPGWLHEIKHDGFRILARRDSAGDPQVTVFDAKKRSHTAIEQPIASTKRPG
jgi:ATP-dependent DNA ligase